MVRPLTAFLLVLGSCSSLAGDEWLHLAARRAIETAPGSGRYHVVTSPLKWKASETAIVVCDMWDAHWCRGATRRVAEMAPRMDQVLKVARCRGALIVHCPSDCMKFYEAAPQRLRALTAPKLSPMSAIAAWMPLDAAREPSLPIDDADGGCDCAERCPQANPWTRQIATLEIAPEDAIADGPEAYYLMRDRCVKNVIVMGVHANMCVLGRPFAIRQMVTQGLNVVLMRDLTDTMYSARSAPHVSHFSGTDLVVEHIERHWCPTVTSDALAEGDEFRFSEDKRRHIALLMSEDEYDTQRTLTDFARMRLQRDFRLTFVYGSETDVHDMPGIEAVRDADVVVISMRRRLLSKAQLDVLREHVAKSRAVVGIRTASHAFLPPDGNAPPPGRESWAEFDRDVLGGHYTRHYDNKSPADPQTLVRMVVANRGHPVLKGVPSDEFAVRSWLYATSPLAVTASPLMVGHLEGRLQEEPVAWINRAGKSRVFYTSLGHPEDFQLPAFTTLLENGIRWCAQ